MAKSITATIEKTAENQLLIPTENFTQIDNDLYDLSITGTKDIPAATFQTLCFIIRLHPDFVITDKNVSKQMEFRATKNRGKFKKPETIRAEFGHLCKAGYMNKKLNFDSNGGSLPTQYFINYKKIYGGGGKISTPPQSYDKHKNPKGKVIKIGGGENSTPPYNKERASIYNTSGNTKEQQQPVSDRAVDCVVVSFDERIEKILEDRSDIQREWIKNSLKIKGQTVENIILAIKKSNDKDNPTAFIRSALEKGWKFDSKKRQSLTQSQSDSNRPINPRSEKEIQEQKQFADLYKNKPKRELGPMAKQIMERMDKIKKRNERGSISEQEPTL